MVTVSVLLAVYNNKDDVINAIKSILNQTYTDWELIIIDDCSTDGTFEVVKDFIESLEKEEKKYNIVHLRNEKNQGVYVSLNEGLLRSTGKYICRIDSDDTVIDTHIQINIEALEEHPTYVASRTKFQRETHPSRLGEVTLFYKRSIIEKIGFYDSVRFGADSEFRERIGRTYRNGIFGIGEITYHAKRRPNSLTTSKSSSGKVRKNYIEKYRKWHRSTKNLYMPYPPVERPFEVDKVMLP